MQGSVLRAAESGERFLHGGARSHFALALAADAIGQREKPSVRARLRGRAGSHVAKIVLIVRAHAARIGEFGEFNIQHVKYGEQRTACPSTPLGFGMKLSYRNSAETLPKDCFHKNNPE